ncbi:MarR family winged helix-turn-helix transcriptional regulator [uncultured Anaerovibrio sp.]|uniref:MarR family winged helix-turn-helix transcriptional regulator n=1 Tax=uncultured Anaerovibrio sp. TaxID=361586 RepID=UPI0026113CAB|nr:MarR family transcriptional regulator [uncultured Anaerovibrio sp.]
MNYYNAAIDFGIIRRCVQSLIVEACMELGLTYAEYILLYVLYDREGCSQEDMASYIRVDKAAITRAIQSMELRGFLYRKQDSTDRRLKRLYLTSAGKEIESKVKGILESVTNYIFSDGFTELEQEIFVKCLQKISIRISNADFSTIFGNMRR